ncbi:MAG TPA: YopX family protein [Ktedonobacteraceae bacterium]|nr:YopX family protein [Ktedonobacteraceae bacterium]
MREHKYRAWHKQRQQMYHVALIFFDVQTVMLREGDTLFSATFEEVELMEYTGALDCHGHAICDGDILQWVGIVAKGYPLPKPVEVSWHEALCGFEPFCFYDSHCDGIPTENVGHCYEIAGNRYKHPHLLAEVA